MKTSITPEFPTTRQGTPTLRTTTPTLQLHLPQAAATHACLLHTYNTTCTLAFAAMRTPPPPTATSRHGGISPATRAIHDASLHCSYWPALPHTAWKNLPSGRARAMPYRGCIDHLVVSAKAWHFLQMNVATLDMVRRRFRDACQPRRLSPVYGAHAHSRSALRSVRLLARFDTVRAFYHAWPHLQAASGQVSRTSPATTFSSNASGILPYYPTLTFLKHAAARCITHARTPP